jgi:hypothetical protein
MSDKRSIPTSPPTVSAAGMKSEGARGATSGHLSQVRSFPSPRITTRFGTRTGPAIRYVPAGTMTTPPPWRSTVSSARRKASLSSVTSSPRAPSARTFTTRVRPAVPRSTRSLSPPPQPAGPP